MCPVYWTGTAVDSYSNKCSNIKRRNQEMTDGKEKLVEIIMEMVRELPMEKLRMVYIHLLRILGK